MTDGAEAADPMLRLARYGKGRSAQVCLRGAPSELPVGHRPNDDRTHPAASSQAKPNIQLRNTIIPAIASRSRVIASFGSSKKCGLSRCSGVYPNSRRPKGDRASEKRF